MTFIKIYTIIDNSWLPQYAWKMRISLLLTITSLADTAQQPLRQQLRNIAAEAKGKVAVACSLPGTPLDCDVDSRAHPPMQSVFKLPLALTILHQVEQGQFVLDQPIRFRKSDLILPKPYSPLQDKYPAADVDVSLRDLLQMTVSLSDNTAADVLLRLAGGPKVVEGYITSLGINGFQMRDGEGALHHDHSLQYRNWFEPMGAVQLLLAIRGLAPLNAEHTTLLLNWMYSSRIRTRLGGDLPKATPVAHKAGTSDVENGIAAATNDIGLITLPDGRQLAIAVFVTDSTADEVARDKIIARIGRAVYDSAILRR
jgi:beta-lactamase class A